MKVRQILESSIKHTDAVSHAMEVGHNQHDANICMQSPLGAARYAIMVLKRRWRAAEPVIFSIPPARISYSTVMTYCTNFKVKAPEHVEQWLLPGCSLKEVVQYVMATKSKTGEKYADQQLLTKSVVNIVKDLMYTACIYIKLMKDGEWPEFEKRLLDEVEQEHSGSEVYGLYFFRDAMTKSRWVEYEQIMKDKIEKSERDWETPRDEVKRLKSLFQEYLKTSKERGQDEQGY